MNDAQAIRDLVQRWLAAAERGDVETLLRLVADDVVFMVAGREPFGKEAFAASWKDLKDVRIKSRSDIQELVVAGDWARMRNWLEVIMTPAQGAPNRRSGYVLTILRKNSSGDWVIARDANLLAA